MILVAERVARGGVREVRLRRVARAAARELLAESSLNSSSEPSRSPPAPSAA